MDNTNTGPVNVTGKRIKNLRWESNITQEEMARHFGISQSNYGRMEKDDSRINILNLKVFCRVLGTTTEYLLNGVFYKLPYKKHND